MKVDLEADEWTKLMAVLATAPWNVANPLLMKIGEQLRYQQAAGAAPPRQGNNADLDAAVAGLAATNQAKSPAKRQ